LPPCKAYWKSDKINIMKKKSILISRIVYTVCLPYFLLARLVPLRLWVLTGKAFGLFLYLIDNKHRKIAFINLRFAFGATKTEKEIRVIARKVFEEFGMIAHEWIKVQYIKKEALNNLIEVEGEENLRAAKEKNPSVILLGAHFGNWEYAHLYYAANINRLNFIVRKVDNPFFELGRLRYNTRFGVNILYKQNGLRPAIKSLKNGEDLVIVADHKVNLKEGILSRFFGKDVATIPVAPALSEKYHAPVIPMFIVRCDDYIHHKIIFLPELELDPGDGDEMIARATQRQNDIFEEIIRKYPHQWLWFHRRWSYHYREIYK
jgi:Kdo2-lipid IVA lauroyltransferase/acyltransferase